VSNTLLAYTPNVLGNYAKMKYSKLLERLQNLIGFVPTQADLCRILNFSSARMANRATRDSYFTEEEIQEIERFYGVLLNTQIVSNDCVEVDYYPDIYASCGTGCIVFDESKEKLTIAKSTIPYYSPNEKYFVVTCKGSSMSPILEDDDKAIIQQWQGEQIIDDRIYLFSYNSELFIKRLVKNLDQIVVISENKTFENRIVTKKDEFRIIGQIVGMFRDLK
jgi:phage repressor protein C with HTH and peptisase S24 domain